MTGLQTLDTGMLSQLQELLGGRFAELIDRFIGDGQRRLALLKAALPGPDFDTIHAEAHGLKGSSRNMGANGLGDLCADLEEQGRCGNGDNLATILAAIEQEFAAVCLALRGFSATN